MHGKGTITWPDGRIYTGVNYEGYYEYDQDYLEDKKHGKGVF